MKKAGEFPSAEFDYPTDMQLPNTKFGWKFVTSRETYCSSWKINSDSASQDSEFWMDPNGYPQVLIIKKGTVKQYRVMVHENSNSCIYYHGS